MHRQSVLFAAAGLAASGSAFLMPPEITDIDVEMANALAALMPDTSSSQTIEMECPGCPVALCKIRPDQHKFIELNFNVEQRSDGDHLFLNGWELYPNADPFSPEELRADEFVDTPDANGRHHLSPAAPTGARLGFGLQVLNSPEKPADQNYELLDLDLQIFQVGDAFVDGLPNVHVKLVKESASNRLMIGRIDPTPPLDKDTACNTILCRTMRTIKDKFASLTGMGKKKPCHGKTHGYKGPAEGQMPGHIKGIPGKGRLGHAHPADKIHGGLPIHGSRPHIADETLDEEPRHNFATLVHSIIVHIIMPVLVGILAGVTVSVIGMAMGTLVFAVFRRIFPRKSVQLADGTQQYRPINKEAAAEEEKAGLVEHQDPPPSYDPEPLAQTNNNA